MVAKKFRSTFVACCGGYISQSICVNFAPLLFATFQKDYGVSLSQLSLLVFITFGIQLVSDVLMSRAAVKFGMRRSIVLAHLLEAAGLALLPILPKLTATPFTGIVLATVITSLGAAIVEVSNNPIADACPSENKSATLVLLHSFYCWGSAFVILLTTAFFVIFGVENWLYLSLIWALIPFSNAIIFTRVPINTQPGDQEENRMPMRKLLINRTMLLLFALMIVAGAAELCIAQWASIFAENGLGVSKALGDLLGPTLFALCMGAGRLFYAKTAEKINLENFMLVSSVVCFLGYMVILFLPWQAVSLIGCGIVGLGVGSLWPGSLALGSKRIPFGGTVLFALLACGGDMGCTIGPPIVGFVSDLFGGDLKKGLLVAAVFPLLAFILLIALKNKPKKEPEK